MATDTNWQQTVENAAANHRLVQQHVRKGMSEAEAMAALGVSEDDHPGLRECVKGYLDDRGWTPKQAREWYKLAYFGVRHGNVLDFPFPLR